MKFETILMEPVSPKMFTQKLNFKFFSFYNFRWIFLVALNYIFKGEMVCKYQSLR